jgi:8-oxo-dGTP diphosphatase
MREIEVAAALVFRDGKLLITQRHADAHLGGLWEFPGGKREPGEPFDVCLKRELREELGIEVAVGELLESLVHHYSDRIVHLQFYRCRWMRNEPQLLDCADFRWVSLPEMGNYEFPAADAQLLQRLRDNPDLWETR